MEQGYSYTEATFICEVIEEFAKAGRPYDQARTAAAHSLRMIKLSQLLLLVRQPGPIGLEIDRNSGLVLAVMDGHAKKSGIEHGMTILNIGNAAFSFKALMEAAEGHAAYTITLAKT